MKSKIANGHCVGVEEVSFAQTCQLPLPPIQQSLKEEKSESEGVITKRCFVLLSDDGRRLKW